MQQSAYQISCVRGSIVFGVSEGSDKTLGDAIEEIRRESEAAADRRNQELKRRADVRRVDDFLLCIEDIIENRRGPVPEPVMDEITGSSAP